MSIHLLVNPAAGRGRGDRLSSSIIDSVREHITEIDILSPSSIEETKSLLQQTVGQGAKG